MESVAQQVDGKEDKISKIIDKVLKQVFGEEATHLIYRHLENNYSLKRNEITEKIDVFAAGLEEFLRSGAYVIERKILEDIYSNYGLLRRLELERVQEESDFVSQVKSLMRKA
jgi:5'-deoxynucleotidase YfbR-like HD superfamily hydrolase